MTFNSTDNPSPIFENGKLKPGIYKIQNIYAETYLDIEVHSRELRCRSANDLREGMGLVRPHPLLRLVSDHWKWEIKPFGAGYTIQRVSVPIPFATISATVR